MQIDQGTAKTTTVGEGRRRMRGSVVESAIGAVVFVTIGVRRPEVRELHDLCS